MTKLMHPGPFKKKFPSQILQVVSLSLTFGLCLVVISYNVGQSNEPLDNGNQELLQYSFNRKDHKEEGPIVETSLGKIRGKVLTSRDGKSYSAFYHIPYAQPPIGQYRFQAPRPLGQEQRWRGVRDGTIAPGEASACIQFKNNKTSGTEDCLYLNVYTRELPKRGRRRPDLPVLVYFFGGAFLFGRANRYGGDYMMDEEAVVVLLEYRVGNIGFLNTEDDEIRGNQASKDHVMALKWVQREIQNFGGDRKKVLIFGNSSGATAVHCLILSPMARGLFSTAVSQSKTAVPHPGDGLTRPRESAKELGRQLNCPVENTTKLHQCLIEKDVRDVVGVELNSMLYHSKDGIPSDGDLSTVFMPDFPTNLLKNGQFNKNINWIVGANSAEDYSTANELLVVPQSLTLLNDSWTNVAPLLVNFKDDDSHNASTSLRQFYFGSKSIDMDTRWNLTNLLSDSNWVHPFSLGARYHSKFGGKSYFYWLTKEPIVGNSETSKFNLDPPFGVGHADEVQYFFNFERFPYIHPNSSDYQISKKLIHIWVEFARTGNPGIPEWTPLSQNGSNSIWMELNNKHRVMTPFTERINFFDTFPLLFPDYLEPL